MGPRTRQRRHCTRTWGTLPTGYDMIDNDGNGSGRRLGSRGSAAATRPRSGAANLHAHKHNTARAEMLYAILVEGSGAARLGVQSRRLHRQRGERHRRRRPARVRGRLGPAAPVLPLAAALPLRHPARAGDRLLGLHADTSCCSAVELFNPPYRSPFEDREQDPLDPNQQLMAPAWWSSGTGANSSSPFASLGGPAASVGGSGGVLAFEYFFHRLTEPFPHTGNTSAFTGTGGRFPLPQGLLLQTPDRLFGARPEQLGIFLLYPSLVFPNPPPSNAASPDLLREQRHTVSDPTLFGSGETIPAGTVHRHPVGSYRPTSSARTAVTTSATRTARRPAASEGRDR